MSSHKRKFLIFRLQSSLFALDLSKIAEVSDTTQMWPIPLAPACYSGSLNFHGDIVAALDLTLFLGLAGSNPPGKIIILNQDVASLAFLIDAVVRIVSMEDTLISTEPLPGNVFAAGTLGLPEGNAILLDLDLLVLNAEFCVQENGQKL